MGKGMIFAGCERFWVIMGVFKVMLFSGFVFESLGWKFGDIQRFSVLWNVLLSLFSFVSLLLIIFSDRGQEESRAPP